MSLASALADRLPKRLTRAVGIPDRDSESVQPADPYTVALADANACSFCKRDAINYSYAYSDVFGLTEAERRALADSTYHVLARTHIASDGHRGSLV